MRLRCFTIPGLDPERASDEVSSFLFSNEPLAAMVCERIASPAALAAIPGVGPAL